MSSESWPRSSVAGPDDRLLFEVERLEGHAEGSLGSDRRREQPVAAELQGLARWESPDTTIEAARMPTPARLRGASGRGPASRLPQKT